MGRTRHGCAIQDGLKLAARLESLHFGVTAKLRVSFARGRPSRLDSQALAALGAASIDHRTTTAGLHANQEAVGAGAANLGRLVSAFHFENPKGLNEDPPSNLTNRCLVCAGMARGTGDYRKFSQHRQDPVQGKSRTAETGTRQIGIVDKILIS